MFKTLTRLLSQRKINRWLRYQDTGMSTADALRKAGLTASHALWILEPSLNGHLSKVGILIGGSKRNHFSSARDQIPLALRSIGLLVPLLEDVEKEAVISVLRDLTEHNWGYVREGANNALKIAGYALGGGMVA